MVGGQAVGRRGVGAAVVPLHHLPSAGAAMTPGAELVLGHAVIAWPNSSISASSTAKGRGRRGVERAVPAKGHGRRWAHFDHSHLEFHEAALGAMEHADQLTLLSVVVLTALVSMRQRQDYSTERGRRRASTNSGCRRRWRCVTAFISVCAWTSKLNTQVWCPFTKPVLRTPRLPG
jgi:hypothetical protein